MRWIRRWITEVVFFLGFIVLLAILAKMFYRRLPEVEQVQRIARAQKKQLVSKDLQLKPPPEQQTVLPNFLEQAHGRTADKWYVPIPMVKVKLIVEPEEMKKWKKVYDQLMRQSIMTDDLQVWFKGTFEDIETGYRQPVRFRLRGDLYVHWARPNYSSLRIKFPKDKPWRHLRTVQFIVFLHKAVPIDFLANEIAGKLGLIHYRMGLAQFQLNNEKPQCYSFVETISEEMLALNRRSGSAVFSSDDRWLKRKYMFPGQAPESLPTLHFRNRYKTDDTQVQWKNLDDLLKLNQAASEDLPIEMKKQMIQQFKDLVNIDSYMRLCAMSVFFNSAHLHSLQNV